MASLINDVEHPQLSKEMRGPNANVRPGVYSRTLVEEVKNQVYNVLLTKKRVKIDEKWSLAQKQRVFEQEVRPLLNSSGDYKTHEDLMKSLGNELISDIKENFTKTKSYLIDPSILGGTYLREEDASEENEKKNRKHFEIRSFIDVDNTVTGIQKLTENQSKSIVTLAEYCDVQFAYLQQQLQAIQQILVVMDGQLYQDNVENKKLLLGLSFGDIENKQLTALVAKLVNEVLEQVSRDPPEPLEEKIIPALRPETGHNNSSKALVGVIRGILNDDHGLSEEEMLDMVLSRMQDHLLPSEVPENERDPKANKEIKEAFRILKHATEKTKLPETIKEKSEHLNNFRKARAEPPYSPIEILQIGDSDAKIRATLNEGRPKGNHKIKRRRYDESPMVRAAISRESGLLPATSSNTTKATSNKSKPAPKSAPKIKSGAPDKRRPVKTHKPKKSGQKKGTPSPKPSTSAAAIRALRAAKAVGYRSIDRHQSKRGNVTSGHSTSTPYAPKPCPRSRKISNKRLRSPSTSPDSGRLNNTNNSIASSDSVSSNQNSATNSASNSDDVVRSPGDSSTSEVWFTNDTAAPSTSKRRRRK